jgi:DNA invertase Pin-like site-specific DNA recombinase
MIKKEFTEKGCGEIFDMFTELLEDDDVTELKFDISKKKCLMTVKGKRENNESFRITKTLCINGTEESASDQKQKTDPSERAKAVKEMREKGYKQQEIADTLGISQAQVSNILRAEKK